MCERDSLLKSVASTLGEYRKDDGFDFTSDHVDRWLSQFQAENQLDFLREFDHVMKRHYVSRSAIKNYLLKIASDKDITGPNPAGFWRAAYFLNIQKNGNSQNEILKIFSECLWELFQLDLNQCGGPGGDFIYFDDVLFSGSRVGNDFDAWIRDSAPYMGTVRIIVVGTHRLGTHTLKGRLLKARQESGKKLQFKIRSAVWLENRAFLKNDSNLLWPSFIPDTPELVAYVAQLKKFPHQNRIPYKYGVASPFATEAGRQILEKEFLIAGARIWANIESPKPSLRPLGYSYFGLGFGSMVVTYRNCPNNCPLAMWWGDTEKKFGKLHWYPLLPRKGYSSINSNESKVEDDCSWF